MPICILQHYCQPDPKLLCRIINLPHRSTNDSDGESSDGESAQQLVTISELIPPDLRYIDVERGTLYLVDISTLSTLRLAFKI